MIRADGSISKCTVALYDDRNTVGRLLPDGTVEIDKDRMNPWLDVLLHGTDADRACPIKRLPRATEAATADATPRPA